MPIRFSTEAANADTLRDDTEPRSAPEGTPQAVGADGTPRDRSAGPTERQSKGGDSNKDNQVKPGKDINAAGFIKDKDSDKP
jgi:hypothetical protein